MREIRLLNLVHNVAVALIFLVVSSCASLSPPQPAEPVLAGQPEIPDRDWVVFLGDSGLSGYGSNYSREQGIAGLMDQYFYFKGLNYQVYNAGVNGDTATGILNRLDEYLVPATSLIILKVGDNDLQHGVSVETIKQNIRVILARIHSAHISAVPVLLLTSLVHSGKRGVIKSPTQLRRRFLRSANISWGAS